VLLGTLRSANGEVGMQDMLFVLILTAHFRTLLSQRRQVAT